MTSLNGTFSTLLALREGNPPVTGGSPSQRPLMRSFGVFYLCVKKRLIKQSRRWFETLLCLYWHHCNELRLLIRTKLIITHAMAGRQTGYKPLPGPGMTEFNYIYMHHLTLMNSFNSLAPEVFDYSLKLINFKLILTIIFCGIAIRWWMPQHLTDH